MHIAVIGTGYVGLVSGACFAEFGNRVTCVDSDAIKIDMIKAGKMPIYEPGLEALVAKNVREGRLEFTTDINSALEKSIVVTRFLNKLQLRDACGRDPRPHPDPLREREREHMRGT